MLTLEEIKYGLDEIIEKIEKEKELILFSGSKNPKIDYGKYLQLLLSKLRLVLGNQEKNATMRVDVAEKYYWNEEDGLEHIQERYQLILELQDYIVCETCLPFIYDRYTIFKLLQISSNTYNMFIDDCQNGVNARNEDIANVFLDIETMLLNDRNASAENGTKNAKAIDTINRYKKHNGGFGVVSEKDDKSIGKGIIIVTPEETQRKINAYGFSNLLEENSKNTKK